MSGYPFTADTETLKKHIHVLAAEIGERNVWRHCSRFRERQHALTGAAARRLPKCGQAARIVAAFRGPIVTFPSLAVP
jgi:hypothetical protein